MPNASAHGSMKPKMRCMRYGEETTSSAKPRASSADAARAKQPAVHAAEEQHRHRDRGDHHEGAEVRLAQQQPRRRAASRRASAAGRAEAVHARASCAPCSRRRRAPPRSFISSEGWKFATPSGDPAPRAVHLAPEPGTSTSTSSTSAADEEPRRGLLPEPHRHQEHRRSRPPAPTARKTAWRTRK